MRTIPRCWEMIITIMASEGTIPEVIGKGDATVRTLEGKPTIRTEYKIGKSPPVEKKQALFFILNIFLKCCPHFLGKESLFLLHVHNLHRRERFPLDSLRKAEEMKFSFLGIIKRF
jgi:hypothetical protein